MSPKNILTKAILAVAGIALSSSAAMAVNPNFVAGDLVVFFQQRGGTNTIMLDLGAATTFRDATANVLNIANLGTELADGTNGFGSGWANDTSLFWGAAAVRSSSSGPRDIGFRALPAASNAASKTIAQAPKAMPTKA